jgi:hypothetical protein
VNTQPITTAHANNLTLPNIPLSNQWLTQEFFCLGGLWQEGFFGGQGGGMSTNSVEDRGQRERGSGGGNPLVRGSTQFANE